MSMVSQVNSKNRSHFITHEIEMPVPYSFYSATQKKQLCGKVCTDVCEIIVMLYQYKKVR